MESQNYWLFMSATLALNLTPGPDMLYVVTRSIAQGTKAGLVSSVGIAAGCCVHMFLVAFGLAALLNAVPFAFDAIKYAGALYLVYLGVKILFSKNAIQTKEIQQESLSKIFRDGFVTNVLNPKVALFFMAFLPQFVNPNTENFSLSILVLGTVFNICGTLVNFFVASTAGFAGQFIRERIGTSSAFKWILATVFVGLGLKVAFQRKN